jgi:hypothetical protein
MKRVIFLSIFVLSLSFLTNADAEDTTQEPPKGQASVNAASSFITEIDGVAVPLEVLTYVNTEYLGHVVSKVDKLDKGGGLVFYRLLIEQDSLDNDRTNLYLIYNDKWVLQEEVRIVTPVIHKSFSTESSGAESNDQAPPQTNDAQANENHEPTRQEPASSDQSNSDAPSADDSSTGEPPEETSDEQPENEEEQTSTTGSNSSETTQQ